MNLKIFQKNVPLPRAVNLSLAAIALVCVGASADAAGEGTSDKVLSASFPAVPEYAFQGETLVIKETSAWRIDWETVLTRSLEEKLVHNDSEVINVRRLSTEELAGLVRKDFNFQREGALAQIEEEGFFTLWKVGELRARSDENVVVMRFDINTLTAKDAFLSIGCDYAFAALVNGRPIYARAGYEGYRTSADLMSLPLAAGRNEVAIVFQGFERKWRRTYYQRSWMSKIQIFGDEKSARDSFVSNHNSAVENPVVTGLSSIKARNGFPILKSAKLVDVKGNLLGQGTILPDSSIKWTRLEELTPPVVILSIDGVVSSPVIVTGGSDLNALGKNLEFNESDPLSRAWAFRVQHLLKPEFKSERVSYLWCSKLASAMAAAGNPNVLAENPDIWRSGLQLASYVSSIDGSLQYYQFYTPPASRLEGRKSPLVIFAPTPNDPVRPFLESTVMAGQYEFENWCSVADQLGCVLLWAGTGNVDGGGELAIFDLTERYRDFMKNHGTEISSGYVFGACAAGVTASGFATRSGPEIAGIILHSPILHRNGERTTPGIDDFEELRTVVPNAQNSVDNIAKGLRGKTCTVLYDSGMEGHGNILDTQALVNSCLLAGVSVVQPTCGETREWVWGERMKYRMSLMLGAAFKLQVKNSENFPQAEIASTVSIKNAMMGGYVLKEAPLSLNGWIERWEEGYRKWRSAPLPLTKDLHQNSQVNVQTKIFSISDVRRILVSKQIPDSIQENEQYCGLYLDQDSNVVMFTSENLSAPPPNIDPLLDGRFLGLVCSFKLGKWITVAKW